MPAGLPPPAGVSERRLFPAAVRAAGGPAGAVAEVAPDSRAAAIGAGAVPVCPLVGPLPRVQVAVDRGEEGRALGGGERLPVRASAVGRLPGGGAHAPLGALAGA